MKQFQTVYSTGFSIIELMVALLLGTLVSIAATQLFLVNRQSENLQQGIASVQDQGRFLLDYMARDLMQAGYDPNGFAAVPFMFDNADVNKNSRDLAGSTNDTIIFQVNDGIDCVGNSYSGLKGYEVSDNGLKCVYWTPTERKVSGVIVDGVESMQVQYGIDFDHSGRVQLYTNATGAKAALQGYDKARILAVRFAVLLTSDGRVGADPELAPDSVVVLDKTFAAGTGATNVDLQNGHLHRLFSATVLIRNQIDENS